MAQIECGRGHLYDPDKFPACPYCNNHQQITVAAAGRTAPLSGRVVTAPGRTAPLSGTPVTAAQPTAPLSGTPVTAAQKTQPPRGYTPVTADAKTQPPKGYIPVTAASKTMPPRGYEPAGPGQSSPMTGPVNGPVNGPGAAPTMPPSPFAGVSVAQGGRTVGLMQEKMGFDPVVGWLACVAGPSRGKSYTIRGGINSIGRGDRMDIVITGDMKLSAENHAKISYSDRNNRFNLIPGDGRNIIYLNGDEVFSPMALQAYDLIDFGETKLLFVPLCGERFTWEGEKEAGHGAAE